MHATFGDDFAIKMSELLKQPDILQKYRTARAGGHRVLVIDNRRAGGSSSFLPFME